MIHADDAPGSWVMGRLTNMRPMVAMAPPRLARHTDAEGHSRDLEPWRAWYSLKRWRDLRWRVFRRDRFRCQCGCGVLGVQSRDLVADHVKAHRGDPALFWDEANVQTLLKVCHDRIKQAAEAAVRHGRRRS